MKKNKKNYSISFYTNLPKTKESWAEIRRAMRVVERAYKWADRRLRKALRHMFEDYPNNHSSNELKIAVNVDKDNTDHCGGVFYPENNEIIINKYVEPIVLEGKEPYLLNLFDDKNRLRHIIAHELIHYAFAEYEYSNDKEEPTGWTVGLCSEENTANPVEKLSGTKWKVEEWLDEVLTERLAMHISGWAKTDTMLYENNISDEDKNIFEQVKQKLTVGPVVFESIVNALYYHDKSIFLDSLTLPIIELGQEIKL